MCVLTGRTALCQEMCVHITEPEGENEYTQIACLLGLFYCFCFSNKIMFNGRMMASGRPVRKVAYCADHVGSRGGDAPCKESCPWLLSRTHVGVLEIHVSVEVPHAEPITLRRW